MKPTVIIHKCASDEKNRRDQFLSAAEQIGLLDHFNKSKAVFIKPNITYPFYKMGVTTRVEFVEDLVAALRENNSSTKIFIGEGEGGYNSFSTTKAFAAMGYNELSRKFPNVEIVNLSKIPSETVDLFINKRPYPLKLPAMLLNDIDFSITCPVPKMHCVTGITLSIKNQWGCLPDTMRLKNHFVFNAIIGQVCSRLKFKYAFLDGKFGLDRNGPMDGDPIELNWFAASNSLGAFDMVVAKMMGISWKKIPHLRISHNLGYIPEEGEIKVIGENNFLYRKFNLKRTFWNYPALIAFHSQYLTKIVYLSKVAKPIHIFMYLFRKRPIDDVS
jgi:uncharacterized protein (DUF362 family)